MSQNDAHDITNAMLLEHMQSMKYSMVQKIERIEKKLGEHDKRFDERDEQFRKINMALQRLYERRVEMSGRIERIEERVDIT